MSLIEELKRRNVIRVAGLYLVGSWLMVQVAATLLPVFEAPAWVMKVLLVLLAAGFVAALVSSWIFELTPDGLKRDADVLPGQSSAHPAARRMDRVIIGVLALALGYFALDKFVLSRRADQASSDTSSSTTAATRPRSLAVLPFASPGEDAESNALAGGLHDTLITQLSKLNGLEVRSRTSVMKFKDWTGGLKPIAQELAVNVVLEGTVQRQGNRAVVNAQLIDARTDAHLWAETFDRTSDDVFALQAEIAQRVVQSLEVALSPQERKVLTEAPTENRAAYALFVQAQRELNEGQVSIPEAQNEARRKRGAEMLEKAVAADPKFALAWAALSRAYATLAWDTMYGDYRAYGDKARAAAERAVALGADLPEAHFASGSVAMQLDLDFPRAMREFELAVRGAPGDALFHSRLSIAYRFVGRNEDYERACRRAHELDPTNLPYALDLQSALIVLRRLDDALALARETATLHPDVYAAAFAPAEIEGLMQVSLAPAAAFVRANGERFKGQPGVAEDRWVLAMAEADYAGSLAALDEVPAEARSTYDLARRGASLRRLGRDAEARVAYAALRDDRLAMLRADRDPFVTANARADLALALAALGDKAGARESIAHADRLWGIKRDPSDGSVLASRLLRAEIALGDFDAACARAEEILGTRSLISASSMWLSVQLGELHVQPCFRTLMQKHGIDVSKEPFAFNRAGAGKAGDGNGRANLVAFRAGG